MLMINQYYKKGEKVKTKTNETFNEFNISSDEEEDDSSLNESTNSENSQIQPQENYVPVLSTEVDFRYFNLKFWPLQK